MGYDGVPKSLLPDSFPGYLAKDDDLYLKTLELQTGAKAALLAETGCALAHSFASLEAKFNILSR